MEEGKKDSDRKSNEKVQWDIEFLKYELQSVKSRIAIGTFGMWVVIIIMCFALGFLFSKL